MKRILIIVLVVCIIITLCVLIKTNNNIEYSGTKYRAYDMWACITFDENGEYGLYDCDSNPTNFPFDSEWNCKYKYKNNEMSFKCKDHSSSSIKILKWDFFVFKFNYDNKDYVFYNNNRYYFINDNKVYTLKLDVEKEFSIRNVKMKENHLIVVINELNKDSSFTCSADVIDDNKVRFNCGDLFSDGETTILDVTNNIVKIKTGKKEMKLYTNISGSFNSKAQFERVIKELEK